MEVIKQKRFMPTDNMALLKRACKCSQPGISYMGRRSPLASISTDDVALFQDVTEAHAQTLCAF